MKFECYKNLIQTLENRNTHYELYIIVYTDFVVNIVLGSKTIFVHVEMAYLMVVYDILDFSRDL